MNDATVCRLQFSLLDIKTHVTETSIGYSDFLFTYSVIAIKGTSLMESQIYGIKHSSPPASSGNQPTTKRPEHSGFENALVHLGFCFSLMHIHQGPVVQKQVNNNLELKVNQRVSLVRERFHC